MKNHGDLQKKLSSRFLLEYNKVNRRRTNESFQNTDWTFQKQKHCTSKDTFSGNPLLAKIFGKNTNESDERSLSGLMASPSSSNRNPSLHKRKSSRPKCTDRELYRSTLYEKKEIENIEELNSRNGAGTTSSYTLDQSCFDESLELAKMCDRYQEKINFVKTLVNDMHSQFERLEVDPNHYYQSSSLTNVVGSNTEVSHIQQHLPSSLLNKVVGGNNFSENSSNFNSRIGSDQTSKILKQNNMMKQQPLRRICIDSEIKTNEVFVKERLKINGDILLNPQDLQVPQTIVRPTTRRAWWVEDHCDSELDE